MTFHNYAENIILYFLFFLRVGQKIIRKVPQKSQQKKIVFVNQQQIWLGDDFNFYKYQRKILPPSKVTNQNRKTYLVKPFSLKAKKRSCGLCGRVALCGWLNALNAAYIRRYPQRDLGRRIYRFYLLQIFFFL